MSFRSKETGSLAAGETVVYADSGPQFSAVRLGADGSVHFIAGGESAVLFANDGRIYVRSTLVAESDPAIVVEARAFMKAFTDAVNGRSGPPPRPQAVQAAPWRAKTDQFLDPDQGVYLVSRERGGSMDRYYAETREAAERLAMALNVAEAVVPTSGGQP